MTSPDIQLLTVVGYIKRHGGDLDARLIEEIKNVALTAKRASVRQRAAQYLVDHWDPVPRAPVIEVTTGPVTISWKSKSPTSRVISKPSSTTPLTGNGHALPSSSATDDLGNLS